MKTLLACSLFLAACQSEAPKPPVPLSDNWCDRAIPGAPGAGTPAEASRAHAMIRFFGPQAKYPAIDAALASALQMSTLPDLDVYAAALAPSVCALAASPSPAPQAARVELKGDVAIVHPGTGAVTLPAGTKAVAVDLRDLPATPELDAQIGAAIAPALAVPFSRSSARVRFHNGFVDETESNLYTQKLQNDSRPQLAAAGTSDLPLLLLTGAKMAPAAADWAGDLRIQGRALLVGASVLASVAESGWSPVAARGLAWRKKELNLAGTNWPDEIAADIRSDQPESEIARARKLEIVPVDFTQQTFARAPFERFDVAVQKQQSTALDLGVMRAALYVAHGVWRLFYSYFAVIGDHIDERLGELLTMVDSSTDRVTEEGLFFRFSNALHDGHVGITDPMYMYPAGSGFVPVTFDWFGDEPIVHNSNEPLLHPGDTVTAVAGMPIKDWYAAELPYLSAATDGAEKLRGGLNLGYLKMPETWTVRDPSGATRDVMLTPQSPSGFMYPPLAPTRASGFLTDLGAPDIYYFNLDMAVSKDSSQLTTQLGDAHGATGVVLDMRGYPSAALTFGIFSQWIGKPWKRPHYIVPTWDGADHFNMVESPQMTVQPPADTSLVYTGPLVWLVGPYTQSAAEDFSMEIVDSGRIKKVVGRTSAGTDGNITNMVLPGGYQITFTGMEVRFPDGKQFDAVGIVPDVVVPPNPADLAAGIDSDLVEAIKQLRN